MTFLVFNGLVRLLYVSALLKLHNLCFDNVIQYQFDTKISNVSILWNQIVKIMSLFSRRSKLINSYSTSHVTTRQYLQSIDRNPTWPARVHKNQIQISSQIHSMDCQMIVERLRSIYLLRFLLNCLRIWVAVSLNCWEMLQIQHCKK